MGSGKFASKGPYVAFAINGGCIGGFATLVEAKKACAHEELTPCGKWKAEENSLGKAYYSNSGCSIYVGYEHPHVKLSAEEIGKATARYLWRENLR